MKQRKTNEQSVGKKVQTRFQVIQVSPWAGKEPLMAGREILMAAAKRGLSDRAEDGLAQPALLVSSEREEVAEEQGAQATLGVGGSGGLTNMRS